MDFSEHENYTYNRFSNQEGDILFCCTMSEHLSVILNTIALSH